MGRRKIEIQPITHERNRSVTFLKRKNGLFKKAYELGVLCSVDVAVIIFEERPGHQLKLYQYGSTDVRSIVQRHARYDGEKDNRGPADFSGNAAARTDDIGDGDGDDDDGDDDTESMPTRATASTKRTGNGKLKRDINTGSPSASSSDLPMNVEMDYHNHRSMTIAPPPMPIHQPGMPTSSLPISGERLSSHLNSNKKLRLMPAAANNASLASPDDQYVCQPPAPPAPPPSFRLQQQGTSYDPFTAFPHTPQSLLVGSFDYHPASSSGGPSGQTYHNTQFATQLRYNPYQDHGQERMFQQLMRQQQRHHAIQAQPSTSAPPPPGLYAPLLEADEHTRHVQSSQGFGAFWPVHGQRETGSTHAGPTATQDTTWLNLFSGPIETLSVPSIPTMVITGFTGDREATSRERDRQDGVERVEQVEQADSSNVGSPVPMGLRSSLSPPKAEVENEDGGGGQWDENTSGNGGQVGEMKCDSTTTDTPDSRES